MLSHTNIVPRFECTLMMCGQYPCAFVCVCVRVGAQVVDDNDVGGHGWLTTVQVHIYLHRKVHACSFVWEFKWAHLTETTMNFPPEHTQQFRVYSSARYPPAADTCDAAPKQEFAASTAMMSLKNSGPV